MSEMRLASPWALAALPAVLLWAALFLRRRSRARGAIPFPAKPLLEPVRTRGGALARRLPAALQVLALLLLAGAAARPQAVRRTALPPTAGVDILLAIDTSPSMKALDLKPFNRLEAAKRAARDFIRARVHDRIGIVVFGGAAMIACPVTLDYASLLDFLDHVEIDMTGVEGTAIGDGIATAVNHLRQTPAKSKVVVLLTDGRSNTGYIGDPLIAAKAAESFGIKIHTIGTAKKGPAPFPETDPRTGKTRITQIDDDLDEETLRAIAGATGGRFFRATSAEELQAIYATIDALEKTELETPEIVRYDDLHAWLLLPALGLLLAETLLSKTLLLTLP